jgi:hypothetical protein
MCTSHAYLALLFFCLIWSLLIYLCVATGSKIQTKNALNINQQDIDDIHLYHEKSCNKENNISTHI